MKTLSTRSKPGLTLLALVTFVLGAAALSGCTAPAPAAPSAAPAQPAAAAQQPAAPLPGSHRSAASAKIMADITVIKMALDTFAMNNAGHYPDSLTVLVTPDMNGHRYLNQTHIPRDPWDREYCYAPGPPPTVATFGADGAPGGTGDDADVDSATLVNGR